MNPRTWRAGVLGVGVAVVVLLATQRAAGEPGGADPDDRGVARQNAQAAPERSNLPVIPESGSLLLLGSAFVVVAQQLRRLS